jgi:hypothetical protein
MDGQGRLDGLFVVPGEPGYAPAYRQIMHPCCADDDESEEA